MAKKKPKVVELAGKEEGLKQTSLFGDDPLIPDTSGENEILSAEQTRYRIYGLNDYNAMSAATWAWRREKSSIEKQHISHASNYSWRLKQHELANLLRLYVSKEIFSRWMLLSILIAANEAVHYADYPSKRN